MSIKLAVALEENVIVRHIRERLDSSKSYSCPICSESVIAKKGQERQHHFAHTASTKCSANEETILHFNSKHFLAYCIRNNIEVTFKAPVELLDSKLHAVFQSLEVRKYPLSLISLLDFYKKTSVHNSSSK